MYNIFHMLLLEQKIIKKARINKNILKLDTNKNSSKYEVEAICNSIVYIKKLPTYLLAFYYLIF